MGDIFDHVQHEDAIYLFEEALCKCVQEDHGAPLKHYVKIDRIAVAAKLSLDLAKKIEQHLEDMEHLSSSSGYTIRFTMKGLESFKEKQSKKSPYTKKRERSEFFKETAKQGGKALGKWILVGVIGILTLAFPINIYKEQIVGWLKKMLGL